MQAWVNESKLILVLHFHQLSLQDHQLRRQVKEKERFVTEASLKLDYTPDNDLFTLYEFERRRNTLNGKVEVTGFTEAPRCRPIVCIANDPKPCGTYFDTTEKNYYYDPTKAASGECCLQPDCTEEQLNNGDQCGEQCPPSSCIPEDEDCQSSDCYVCEQFTREDGSVEDVYTLEILKTKTECFTVAKKEDPELGDLNVGITCGAHQNEFFGAVEENRDIGQLDCTYIRKGQGYTNNGGPNPPEDAGIVSGTLPCVFLQLLFCGCGPRDMFTFGLPAPKFPCRPGQGLTTCPATGLMEEPEVAQKPCKCPIICEDVPGRQDEVCDSFDPIAKAVLGEEADGFDLWAQFFTGPNNLGLGEPDVYEFNIFDV